MKLLILPALSFALCVTYVVANPYWYGDAIWYAQDISGSGALPIDAGHLSWRPIGSFFYSLFGMSVDSLLILQSLSSIASILACYGTYILAMRLKLGNRVAIMSALLIASTNLLWLYGGSGSSYTPALAATLFSVLTLVHNDDEEWTVPQGLIASALFVLGWSFWAIAGLLLPLFCIVAIIFSNGNFARRFIRASVLGGVTLGGIGATAYLSYIGMVDTSKYPEFMNWVRDSSHQIPAGFSVINFARGVLGFTLSFINLGSFGRSIKEIIHGGTLGSDEIVALIAFLVFALVVVVSILLVVKKSLSSDSKAKIVLLFLVCALLPVGGFAIIWQGSDVERFSLAVPYVSLAVMFGISKYRFFSRAFVAGVLLFNLCSFVVPTLRSSGGIITGLGSAASKNMPEGSLVLLDGAELGTRVWGYAEHFSNTSMLHVHYDVVNRGTEGWSSRLQEAMEKTWIDGKEVAVLGELIGLESKHDPGLSKDPSRNPSIAEVEEFFKNFQQGDSWEASGYNFVEITR